MPTVRNTTTSQITGLVSGHRDKAERIAAEYDVPSSSIYSYENFDEIAHNPAIDAVYEVLIRMTRQLARVGRGRPPERPGPALFEGGGNWGVPGDPDRPPCWPQFNSCRLTVLGEQIALELLARHPELRRRG